MSTEFFIPVEESTQASEARRAASEAAQHAGLGAQESGNLALIVREAATNLIKHGGGGMILLRVLQQCGIPGVEMLALDRGRGMYDVLRCLEDGYSTAGSPGTGLGAITRLATMFDLYSRPGGGTALMARIWAGGQPDASAEPFEAGIVSVPKSGEEVCGDGFAIHQRGDGLRVMVVDGLGHGPGAAEASRVAMELANAYRSDSALELLDRAHTALRPTRGAALAVAEVDSGGGLVRFAGLGNISGYVLSDGGRRQMVSHNGTAGHQAGKTRDFVYPWLNDSVLVLHSDGIATHWSLDSYPGLAQRHPSLMAGVLFRDFNRGRDDATVVVVRRRRAPDGNSR